MRAKTLHDLLKAGDRVAVSNITGREARTVTATSQKYCANIVGGWALGKGGQKIEETGGGEAIPVFGNIEELMEGLPAEKRPNKVVVYSPPMAVYGEIKEIIDHGSTVESIFIVTEHVSIEVTAKIASICAEANIDVIGCNSLGMINTHDGVRVGAVGGESPSESFKPGSVAIISNSGNMVNTMASYLLSAGLGTTYGISTGKDVLILMPLKNLLELAANDQNTKIIVLYVEPGGLYEKEAIEEMLRRTNFAKPIIAYVTGEILGSGKASLGHAGAVVEGKYTSAAAKSKLFDDYFGIDAFDPNRRYEHTPQLAESFRRGIRIKTLHHLPAAAEAICDMLNFERDFRPSKPLTLNPWFLDYKYLANQLPSDLILRRGEIPEPYGSQVKLLSKETIGANPPRRNMRNASHASSNDGVTTRIYGFPIEAQMQTNSFIESVFLAWTGESPKDFEIDLLEKCFIASLSNGPGTISAQASKLSASAGNSPNTAMIAALACIGEVHGGNGRRSVEYLLKNFRNVELIDPYAHEQKFNLQRLVNEEADRFSNVRTAAKNAGTDYERIPCLGHPVFRDKPINYDPRERVIAEYMQSKGLRNIFLDFYHMLAARIKEIGISQNVWAVNLDGAIASVVLGACWTLLKEKRITIRRTCDIAFMVFALGRAAGAGGEFLDHQDYGSPMDMRIPANECTALTKLRDEI